MTPITFSDVSFGYPGLDELVFSDLNLELPGGFTFLVGPNGIGKSTLMLLAGARVFPQKGTVTIGGTDTREFADAAFDPEVEQRRNELVSFVYQNMEFETDEPVGTVLSMVARAGADRGVVPADELDDRLNVRMGQLSKGEMQRAIVAMSVLYRSAVVMLDEPVFAVEPDRAERLFAWLQGYCARTGFDMYTSVHDVELARKFGDSVVLMRKDGTITAGPAGELLSRDSLEEAFRAPYDTLYRRQRLYRELLQSGTGEGDVSEGDR